MKTNNYINFLNKYKNLIKKNNGIGFVIIFLIEIGYNCKLD